MRSYILRYPPRPPQGNRPLLLVIFIQIYGPRLRALTNILLSKMKNYVHPSPSQWELLGHYCGFRVVSLGPLRANSAFAMGERSSRNWEGFAQPSGSKDSIMSGVTTSTLNLGQKRVGGKHHGTDHMNLSILLCTLQRKAGGHAA